MALGEIGEVAVFYLELLNYLKEVSNDDYCHFDRLTEDEIKESLHAMLIDPTARVYIASEKGKTIGFLAGDIRGCFLPVSIIKDVGYISGAYVIPAYRDKGVMKNLEEIFLSYLRENNIQYVELNILSGNDTARSCWKTLGYFTFREHMRKKI